MLPPPSPHDSQDPDNEPDPPLAEESTFSARCGERILTFFENLLPDKAPGFTRSAAVASGLGSAMARVIIGAVLIALCVGIAMLWTWGARRIGRLLPDRIEDFGESIPGPGFLILWVIAAGGTLIFSLTDVEKKGRILSWLCFTLVAAGTMTAGTTPFLPAAAVLAGQFAVHYFIHSALNQRDRETERLLDAEREAARAERNFTPQLLNRYRGLSGFAKARENSGNSPGPPEDRSV